MPIAVQFIVASSLKEHSKKHIMFVLKVTSIGGDEITERNPKPRIKSG